MSNETRITIAGNLTADPELRFTQAGKPVANFTIASTPQRYDRNQQQWVDGDTLFMRCSLWSGSENLCDSLHKGDRVIATGRLTQRSYQNRDGQSVTVTEMQVDEIGASLKWVVASVQKPGRGGYSQGVQQAGYTQAGYTQPPQPQQPAQPQQSAQSQPSYNQPRGGADADPWANGGTSLFNDEPPF